MRRGTTKQLMGAEIGGDVTAALEVAAVIHSVDSLDLARRLDRLLEGAAGPSVSTGSGVSAEPAGAPPSLEVPRPVYLEVNVDADERGSMFVREINAGSRSVPTIVLPDGSVMVEPSNEELSEKFSKS